MIIPLKLRLIDLLSNFILEFWEIVKTWIMKLQYHLRNNFSQDVDYGFRVSGVCSQLS
jgi:hypothetical protein